MVKLWTAVGTVCCLLAAGEADAANTQLIRGQQGVLAASQAGVGDSAESEMMANCPTTETVFASLRNYVDQQINGLTPKNQRLGITPGKQWRCYSAFAALMYTDEHTKFLEEALHYELNHGGQAEMQHIFQQYVVVGSPEQINIADSMRLKHPPATSDGHEYHDIWLSVKHWLGSEMTILFDAYLSQPKLEKVDVCQKYDCISWRNYAKRKRDAAYQSMEHSAAVLRERAEAAGRFRADVHSAVAGATHTAFDFFKRQHAEDPDDDDDAMFLPQSHVSGTNVNPLFESRPATARPGEGRRRGAVVEKSPDSPRALASRVHTDIGTDAEASNVHTP